MSSPSPPPLAALRVTQSASAHVRTAPPDGQLTATIVGGKVRLHVLQQAKIEAERVQVDHSLCVTSAPTAGGGVEQMVFVPLERR